MTSELLGHRCSQALQAEGLGQAWRIVESRCDARADGVAGDEKKRNAQRHELLSDRQNVLAPQVHVEERAVQLVLSDCREGRRDSGCRADDLAPKLAQHLLDLHKDERLVLDDKDAETVELLGSCFHGSIRSRIRAEGASAGKGDVVMQPLCPEVRRRRAAKLLDDAALDQACPEPATGG